VPERRAVLEYRKRVRTTQSIYTIIKTTSVGDGNATVVGGGRGWLGVVDTRYGGPPAADAERQRCAYSHMHMCP